jgi:hypothetical protein
MEIVRERGQTSTEAMIRVAVVVEEFLDTDRANALSSLRDIVARWRLDHAELDDLADEAIKRGRRRIEVQQDFLDTLEDGA